MVCTTAFAILTEQMKILESAGRGVCFQMVINQHSPSAEEFRGLFDSIEGAEIIEAPNNATSMQGLSDREVVIAFPGVESYTAVVMRDTLFVDIIRSWFDRHAEKHHQS
jgi:hypothetical protein